MAATSGTRRYKLRHEMSAEEIHAERKRINEAGRRLRAERAERLISGGYQLPGDDALITDVQAALCFGFKWAGTIKRLRDADPNFPRPVVLGRYARTRAGDLKKYWQSKRAAA